METKDFADLSGNCYGLVPAVADANGCGIISSDVIKNVAVVGFELIDYPLLAAMPILEWCANSYDELCIYAIWQNGRMDKLFPMASEQLVISHSQQCLGMKPFVVEAKPVAAYFVNINKYNAIRVILVRKLSTKTPNIMITVYEQSHNFDLEQAAFEVMAIFQSEGERGLEDFKSRFNTGVGLGGHQIKVPAPPIFQVV